MRPLAAGTTPPQPDGYAREGLPMVPQPRSTGTPSWLPPPRQVDRNVEREIVNHRMLNHPNVIGFKEVRRPGARAAVQ